MKCRLSDVIAESGCVMERRCTSKVENKEKAARQIAWKEGRNADLRGGVLVFSIHGQAAPSA